MTSTKASQRPPTFNSKVQLLRNTYLGPPILWLNKAMGKGKIEAKMNSLYQIRSKMLHGTKVIILVKKKIEKEVPWVGFEFTTF